ncbi:glutathione peroxidase [Sedimentitalea xiamensis]
MKRFVLAAMVVVFAQTGLAAGLNGVFASIDGGTLAIEDWRGQPVLVVNTASQCGFTGQYAGLQKIYDRYRARGLVVLAVPSDDFNQELSSAAEVKEFCELNFGLDMPMTDITHVKGTRAHPFFKAVKAETGFEPGWNFNKILLSPEGRVVATWGSAVRPESDVVLRGIESLLN